jgi:hypothetical protein
VGRVTRGNMKRAKLRDTPVAGEHHNEAQMQMIDR